MGRPGLCEKPVMKLVTITPDQNEKWDRTIPAKIRDLLDGVNILKVFHTLFTLIFNDRDLYLYIAKIKPAIIEYIKKHEEFNHEY